MTPKLAGEIKATRAGLEIDGVEFPWFFSVDGVTVNVSGDDLPSVTLTIVADRVLVDNDLRDPPAKATRPCPVCDDKGCPPTRYERDETTDMADHEAELMERFQMNARCGLRAPVSQPHTPQDTDS